MFLGKSPIWTGESADFADHAIDFFLARIDSEFFLRGAEQHTVDEKCFLRIVLRVVSGKHAEKAVDLVITGLEKSHRQFVGGRSVFKQISIRVGASGNFQNRNATA